MTHLCVSKLTSIASDNGLAPGRRQAIFWNNAGILLIGPLGTNFSEILIELQTFSLKKIRLKMSSAKCRPFCLGLNVLKIMSRHNGNLFHRMGHFSYLVNTTATAVLSRQEAMASATIVLICFSWNISVSAANGLIYFNTLRLRQNGPIAQTTISSTFSWMKMLEFLLKFHWSLFARVQLAIFHHWFR